MLGSTRSMPRAASSAVPRRTGRLLRSNGRNKVLFGTNYPMITPAKCLEHLDELELDDETTERFLGGNAERVLGL